ncbi:MAG: hypothetical protein ACR2HV_08715 [Acidimicrobiales bacterium]
MSPATVVTLLALASAAAAVLISRLVFPFLSVDNDDAITRLQADAIAHGHLFVPTLGLPDALRPWLAAVVDDQFVLKYAPVVPVMIAASQVVTGGPGLYLALLAGGTVAMTYLLAVEVLGNRTEALVAAALVAASPLVVVQSALLLSYLPTLLFLETFAWGLIRGVATSRRSLLALSGLALGTAFFARPYDALIFGLPLLAWAFVRRAPNRPSPRLTASLVLPALAPVAGLLAFNAAATGSPFRPPFAFLEPSDAMGFGVRKLYATDPPHRFGLVEGLQGVARHGAHFDVWAAGGLVLVFLAVVTVARRRVSGVGWALVAVGVLVPVSYIVFWGPWNATVLWEGTRYVGPFYFLPVILPLALFGGRGLVDVFRRQRLAGVLITGAIVVLSATALVGILRDNVGFTRQNRSLAQLVDRHGPDQLVFTTLPTPFLMHPTAVVANRWDAGGPIVYAVERGDADIDAAQRMPNRTPYRLRFTDDFRDPDAVLTARLEQLRLVTGPRVEIRVVAHRPTTIAVHRPTPPLRVGLAVSAAGTTRVYPLGDAPVYDERLVIDGGGAELAGRTASGERAAASGVGLRVSLVVWPPGAAPNEGSASTEAAQELVPLRRAGGEVELLVPAGPIWTTGGDTGAPALLELSG